MKKKLAAAMAVLLSAAMLPFTAFAANGPSEQYWTGSDEIYYLAFVGVFHDYDFYDLFSENETHENVIEGAEYDRATNTLTLTDFVHPDYGVSANMMGDDFKLKIVGDCEIQDIFVYGDGYGGSLTITGDGTLTVNKDREVPVPLNLMAEESDSRLTFDKDVTVHLYSVSCPFEIEWTLCDDADKVVTLANGQTVTLDSVREEYTDSESYETIIKQPESVSTDKGILLQREDDPDGIYTAELSAGRYFITKYQYLDEYDAYVPDNSLDLGHYASLEECEEDGYTVVLENQKVKVYYTDEWNEMYNRGRYAEKVTKASDPDSLYCVSYGWYGSVDNPPDIYYVRRLVWNEDEEFYYEDDSFDYETLSPDEFFDEGYSVDHHDVQKNVQISVWKDSSLAPYADGNEQIDYDLVTYDYDANNKYIKYGTYTTSEGGVQTDAGYMIKKLYYNPTYRAYYLDEPNSPAENKIYVSYEGFEGSGYHFETQLVNEPVSLRYWSEYDTFEDYALTDYKVANTNDDKLYIADEITYIGTDEVVAYTVRELQYNESRDCYFAVTSEQYDIDEFESNGFYFVYEEQPKEFITYGDVLRMYLPVYVDNAGNKYLVEDYSGKVYDYNENDVYYIGDTKYYKITENTTVSMSDLTKDTQVTLSDCYTYSLICTDFHYNADEEPTVINKSKVNSEVLSLGSKIILTGAAEGGEGNYTYSYYYKRTAGKVWKAIGDENTAAQSAAFLPTSVGEFDVKVVVSDENGDSAEFRTVVNIVDGNSTAFVNKSYTSAERIAPGTRFYAYGDAEGSDGFRYAFYYKREGAKYWTVLGEEFGDATRGSFKPSSPGEFTIKVDALDENGELVSKTFPLTVKEESLVTNKSKVNSNILSVGSRIIMTGDAEGGDGNFTYSYYYKRSEGKVWKLVGTENTNATSAAFMPTSEGSFDIKVVANDGDGNTDEFKTTVKIVSGQSDAFQNNSYTSATELKAKTRFYVYGDASGSDGYKYAFYYKRAGAKYWTILGEEFSGATNGTFKPASAGNFLIKADVVDKNGELVSSIFELKVTD